MWRQPVGDAAAHVPSRRGASVPRRERLRWVRRRRKPQNADGERRRACRAPREASSAAPWRVQHAVALSALGLFSWAAWLPTATEGNRRGSRLWCLWRRSHAWLPGIVAWCDALAQSDAHARARAPHPAKRGAPRAHMLDAARTSCSGRITRHLLCLHEHHSLTPSPVACVAVPALLVDGPPWWCEQ